MKYSTHKFDDILKASRRYMNAEGGSRFDGTWVNTDGDYINISNGLISSKYYNDIVINFKSNGSFTSVFPGGILTGTVNDSGNVITWVSLSGQRSVWVKTSLDSFGPDLSGTWVANRNGSLKNVKISNNVISGFDSEPSDINYQNQSTFQTAFASGIYFGKLNSTNNIITWSSAENPNTKTQWIRTLVAMPTLSLDSPLPTEPSSTLPLSKPGRNVGPNVDLGLVAQEGGTVDTGSNTTASEETMNAGFSMKSVLGVTLALALLSGGIYAFAKNK